MRKRVHFDRFRDNTWPPPNALEPFFIAPKGQEWSFRGSNDSWGLSVQGLFGTGELSRHEQVTAYLYMTGNRDLGVYLLYDQWDGRTQSKYRYYSKGNPDRLMEFVEDRHRTKLSVGLFIPFAEAWKAVKEFMETEGELPASIAWVAEQDLSPDVFPDSSGWEERPR